MTTIRPMTVDDVTEVAALETANQPRPWTEQVFRDELAAPGRFYVVAADDVIVGFGGLMVVGDEAHITNLLVDADHRGRGVGRSLMLALIEEAVDRQAKHLTLEVRRRNHAARSLYAGLGLAPVGVRPDYYGDDDALILWAHDIDRPDYLERLR